MEKVRVSPFCQCRGNLKTANPFGKLTKSSDGMTCDFCEHVVWWGNPDQRVKGTQLNRKKIRTEEGKNRYLWESYTIADELGSF